MALPVQGDFGGKRPHQPDDIFSDVFRLLESSWDPNFIRFHDENGKTSLHYLAGFGHETRLVGQPSIGLRQMIYPVCGIGVKLLRRYYLAARALCQRRPTAMGEQRRMWRRQRGARLSVDSSSRACPGPSLRAYQVWPLPSRATRLPKVK